MSIDTRIDYKKLLKEAQNNYHTFDNLKWIQYLKENFHVKGLRLIVKDRYDHYPVGIIGCLAGRVDFDFVQMHMI